VVAFLLLDKYVLKFPVVNILYKDIGLLYSLSYHIFPLLSDFFIQEAFIDLAITFLI